jgi:prolyl oligopeptidase
LTITAAAGTAPRCDVWIADLTASTAGCPVLRPVQLDIDARTSVVIPAGSDAALLQTNYQAARGRLVTTPLAGPLRRTGLT